MPKKKRAPFSIAFDLPFDEAIAAARARNVMLPDAYYNELPMERRRQAFTVSGLAALDQVQAVLDTLTRHLEDGGTFADFKRQAAAQSWDLPKHRLETIFRNGVQGAYSAGHWRAYEETKEDLPYLMYDAVNDSRTRPAHRELDGIIRPVDDPFWETHSPPLGHNCRCGLIQLDADEAEIRSRDGRGLNQPETPDMQADDAGWGRKPTEWSETLAGLIEKKGRECQAFNFAGKRTAPPIWCHGSGEEYLQRLSALLRAPDVFEAPSPQQIVDFADRARDAKNIQELVLLGPLLESQRIAEATGIVLVSFARAFDNFGIRHAFKKHGNEASEALRGQRAIVSADFALIPLIVSSPDHIEYAGKTRHSHADLIRYKKAIGKETYVYLEEVRRKRRLVALETLYVMRH